MSLLIGNTPTAANIESYAEIVRDRSVLRKMAQAGTQIAENAYNPQGRKTTDLLNDAEQVIFDIAEKGEQSGFVGINTILEDALARMEMLAEQNKVITGLSTGFDDLDKITSGLQRSDLIIIAARPSMGKTSFAMNLAEHAALNAKLPVGIFSMEMSSEQLGMRLISSLGKIDLRKVRTGNLEETGWGQTVEAVSQLTDSYLFIDETPALTPTELRSRARRLARDKGKLGLIVVDYLQLMRIPNTRENRTNEVSEIARALKALAKELDVPVIALSQLNRSLEQRADKRPIMSDLRDSGEIEQLADRPLKPLPYHL
ncbi:replicative DNA helicase [Candidatus Thiomargarita nelsonii]|uniref:Replicative DNA helicase n=1 Tax=Candidatus Thiomargarita nelsonii TaxID=1003181 RepID=A0A176S2N1_9GAMM|nr:replicative DNA helicase [Candidatus Thiomargarita nelsonii]